MKIVESKLKMTLNILKEEPEEWLNFSVGQNFRTNLARDPKGPKFKGLISRTFLWMYFLGRNLRLAEKESRARENAASVEFYFFFDSLNQKTALEEFLEECKSTKQMVIAETDSVSLLGPHPQISRVGFRPSHIFLAFVLFLHRGFFLCSRLLDKDSRLVSWRLDGFLSCYVWIPYFIDRLRALSPSYVVISNDHNPSTRCLIAVCKALSIQTVYMQHATVSDRFHALDTDYAFLDGIYSLECYRGVSGRLPPDGFNNVVKTKVFLSGLKRKLESRACRGEKKLGVVGVALKAADDTSSLVQLIDGLLHQGDIVLIRFHPSSSEAFKRSISVNFEKNSRVLESNPLEESVDTFLTKIDVLIASNTSMHLEAAIVGVSCIYFESSKSSAYDYYGFARRGLARAGHDVQSTITLSRDTDIKPSADAIKYYSHTYGSEWEGREAKLIGEILEKIQLGESPKSLYGYAEI